MDTKGINCSEESFSRAIHDLTHEIHNPNTNVKHLGDVELSGSTMTNDTATLVATLEKKQCEIAQSVEKLAQVVPEEQMKRLALVEMTKESSNSDGLQELHSYNCDDMDQFSVAECPVVSPGYSYKRSDFDDIESSYQVEYKCDSDGHEAPHKSAALCAYSGHQPEEVMEQLRSAPSETEAIEVRVETMRWIVDNGTSPRCSNSRDTRVGPNRYLKSLTVRSELEGGEYARGERIQENNLLTSDRELTDDDNWTISSLSDFDVDKCVHDYSIPHLKNLKKRSKLLVKEARKAEKIQKIHPSKNEYESTDDECWTVSSLSDWADDEYDDGYDTSPWSSNMNLSHKSEKGVKVTVMQAKYPIHSANKCKGDENTKNGREEQGSYDETHEISHVPGLLDQRRLIGTHIQNELPSSNNATILKNEMQRGRMEEGEPAGHKSFCPPVEARRKAIWKCAWAFAKNLFCIPSHHKKPKLQKTQDLNIARRRGDTLFGRFSRWRNGLS